MPHAQKACQKKEREKGYIPKKGMPHAHKACKKKGKDSPHPRKIKKRDGSCKGVHPPSAKKNPHILIRLYDSVLLGSSL